MTTIDDFVAAGKAIVDSLPDAAIVGLRHRLLAEGEVDPDYGDDRPPLPDDPTAAVTDLEPVY